MMPWFKLQVSFATWAPEGNLKLLVHALLNLPKQLKGGERVKYLKCQAMYSQELHPVY